MIDPIANRRAELRTVEKLRAIVRQWRRSMGVSEEEAAEVRRKRNEALLDAAILEDRLRLRAELDEDIEQAFMGQERPPLPPKGAAACIE